MYIFEITQIEDLLGVRVVEIIWVSQDNDLRMHTLQNVLFTHLNFLSGDRSYSYGDHNIGFTSLNLQFLFGGVL